MVSSGMGFLPKPRSCRRGYAGYFFGEMALPSRGASAVGDFFSLSREQQARDVEGIPLPHNACLEDVYLDRSSLDHFFFEAFDQPHNPGLLRLADSCLQSHFYGVRFSLSENPDIFLQYFPSRE